MFLSSFLGFCCSLVSSCQRDGDLEQMPAGCVMLCGALDCEARLGMPPGVHVPRRALEEAAPRNALACPSVNCRATALPATLSLVVMLFA